MSARKGRLLLSNLKIPKRNGRIKRNEGYLGIEYAPMGSIEAIKVRHNQVSDPWRAFVEEMIRKDKDVSVGELCRMVPDGTSIKEVIAYKDEMIRKYWS